MAESDAGTGWKEATASAAADDDLGDLTLEELAEENGGLAEYDDFPF